MIRTPIFTIAISVAALAGAGVAWACSCIPPESAGTQIDDSDVVFVGRAVRSVAERGRPTYAESKVTHFEVVRTLKGEARVTRRIAHPGGSSASCRVNFRPGKSYLILAKGHQGRLSTSLCRQPVFNQAEYDRVAAERAAGR